MVSQRQVLQAPFVSQRQVAHTGMPCCTCTRIRSPARLPPSPPFAFGRLVGSPSGLRCADDSEPAPSVERKCSLCRQVVHLSARKCGGACAVNAGDQLRVQTTGRSGMCATLPQQQTERRQKGWKWSSLQNSMGLSQTGRGLCGQRKVLRLRALLAAGAKRITMDG